MSENDVRSQLDAETSQFESRRALKDLLHKNYRSVQYAYVQFFSEHLIDCRNSVGGDLDSVMLLAVLGQRFLSVRIGAESTQTEPDERSWMSAMRIAEVSGIPRETARRKLLALEVKGLVQADPKLGWRLTSSEGVAVARNAMRDLDNRSIDRLARLIFSLLPLIGELRPAPPEFEHQPIASTAMCYGKCNPVRKDFDPERRLKNAKHRPK